MSSIKGIVTTFFIYLVACVLSRLYMYGGSEFLNVELRLPGIVHIVLILTCLLVILPAAISKFDKKRI